MSNVITAPEDFSNANWSTLLQGVINTNQVIAPDGTPTADELIDDNSSGSGQTAVQQGVTLALSTEYMLSCFFAADGLDWSRIRLINLGALSLSAFFDNATPAVGTVVGANASGIEGPYNGGGPDFYRAWFQFTSDAADATGNLRIQSADADGDVTVDLDGTSSIYLWGADLRPGTSLQPYVSEAGITIGATGGLYTAPHHRRIDQLDRNKRIVRPARGSLRGKL